MGVKTVRDLANVVIGEAIDTFVTNPVIPTSDVNAVSSTRDALNEQDTPLSNGDVDEYTVGFQTGSSVFITDVSGYSVGDAVVVTTSGVVPSPLELNTVYYVQSVGFQQIAISVTKGGAAIEFDDSGTGTQYIQKRGSLEGSFREIQFQDHFETIYASVTPVEEVKIVWSDDGINPNSGVFGETVIEPEVVSGYNTYYYINNGRPLANNYKLEVVNGDTDQLPTPLTISLTWLSKIPYNGDYGKLDDGISLFSRFLNTKSLILAQENDAELNKTDNYSNIEKLPNGGLKVGFVNDVIIDYKIPPASNIPSGAIPVIDPILNTESNVYDTGWYPVSAFPSGQFLNYVSNQETHVYLLNAESDQGDKMVGDDNPFLTPMANRAVPFGAPYFDKWSRVVIVNNSGSSVTDLRLYVRGMQNPPSAIYTPLDQPIFDLFPAPINQAVLKAKDDVTGIYNAPNSHQDYKGTSLVVTQGHRISESFGRVHVQKTATASGGVTPLEIPIHTVASGYRLWVTSIEVVASNTLTSGGFIVAKDGGALGTTIRNYVLAASTNQTTAQTVISIDYSEPLRVDTSFHVSIAATGVGSNVAINISGYEEPLT